MASCIQGCAHAPNAGLDDLYQKINMMWCSACMFNCCSIDTSIYNMVADSESGLIMTSPASLLFPSSYFLACNCIKSMCNEEKDSEHINLAHVMATVHWSCENQLCLCVTILDFGVMALCICVFIILISQLGYRLTML